MLFFAQKRTENESKVDKDTKELIRSAKSGDQGAFLCLRDKYRPLIDSCVYRFSSSDMTDQDREDLSQEALVHFCGAVCSYDCEYENVEFGLYAKICIENRLVSFIRLRNKRNRIRPISLDGEGDRLDIDNTDDILQSLVDRERTSALVASIKKQLSDYENKIWWMYASGMSVTEIAVELSADNKSVSNAIYRIRRKLKASLGDLTKR